jgi:hypothetical protein
MTIYCNFLGYITYKPKVVPRALYNTNNYKFHYHSQYLNVFCLFKKSFKKYYKSIRQETFLLNTGDKAVKR